jgi:hypothetical protein
MRKILSIGLVAAVLPVAAVSTTPAYADGFAAGLLGGLAVGTIFGVAATTPRYYAPPPVYVSPGPIAGCYWTRGPAYWDGYQGAWVYPNVRVCQ